MCRRFCHARYACRMKRILLIHHSQSGHTTALAEAVKSGVLELADDITLRERRALAATLDDLLWAEGLLIDRH